MKKKDSQKTYVPIIVLILYWLKQNLSLRGEKMQPLPILREAEKA